MLGKIVKVFQITTIVVAGIILAQYLTVHLHLSLFMTSISAALFGAIANTACNTLISLWRQQTPWIRKQLDPRARFEGEWLIKVLQIAERPNAYARIEYLPETDSYRYSGTAFDAQGHPRAEWKCSAADIDTSRNELRFVAEGEVLDNQGQTIRSYGYIQFEKIFFSKRLRFSRGKGFFYDFGSNQLKSHFLIDRVDPRTAQSVLHKKHAETNKDMKEIILDWHQRNQLV